MAGNNLIFKDAEAAKNAIMDSQKKEITALYQSWADEIGERAKYYSRKSTVSSVVSERQMKELQKMLRTTSQQVSNEIYGKIKNNMYVISDVVVADNIKWLQNFGFSSDGLNAAFNYVPDSVVRNIVTGQIYDGGWNLSKAIWSDNEKALKDIYQIVGKGIAQNMPIYDIAKNLEAYVSPNKKKPWNLKAPDGVKIYKKSVDYNAQRLARTLVQHSYQQSFIATTQKNPFITEYIWHSNGSRVCPLCLDRDGAHFSKDALPMDHPNGMCVMEPVVVGDMVDQLADWFNSPDGTYPEIDEFAGNFGYNAQKGGTVQDYISKYGTSTKNPSAWYHSLTPIQKAEAKLLKDASGLGWDDWYAKNIYTGSADDLVAYKAKVAAKSKATKAVSKVDDTVEVFLSKGGYSTSNLPANFNEWYYKADFDDLVKLTKEIGGNTKLLVDTDALQKYYEKNIAGKTFATKTTNVANEVFDAVKWKDSLKANDMSEFNKWTDDWLKIISANERNGITKYTSNAYRDMNAFLRGQSSSTNYTDEIRAAKSALSKASLPKEVITRRGSDYNMLKELGMGNITSENKDRVIGAIVQEKGFTSTSPSPHGGFSGSIEYVIKLPQGSQAMYVDSISRFQGEQELLINCDAKFMVQDIEFDSYGDVKKIFMTLINLK